MWPCLCALSLRPQRRSVADGRRSTPVSGRGPDRCLLRRIGKRYLDWELDDPTGKTIAEVRAIRDELEGRVRGLTAELEVGAD